MSRLGVFQASCHENQMLKAHLIFFLHSKRAMKIAVPVLLLKLSLFLLRPLVLFVLLPYVCHYFIFHGPRVPERTRMRASFGFSAKPVSVPIRVKSQLSPAVSNVPLKGGESMAAKWAQKTVVIPAQRRECHLITSKMNDQRSASMEKNMNENRLPKSHNTVIYEKRTFITFEAERGFGGIEQDLSEFQCGLAHFFLQHTSASLTINENYDSDVQADTETFLNRIVPEGRSAPWRHTLEGPDDMPAHIKSSMFSCALTIPITNGRFNMGTWQGIWLCEHRDQATPRKIVITLNGM